MKTLKGIAITCLLLSLGIAGCSKTEVIETESPDTAPIETSLIEGSGTTALSLIAYGIVSTIDMTYPGSLVEVLLGDPTLNVERVQNHETDFALANNQAAFKAFNGMGMDKMDKISSVATFYPTTLHFGILAKTGITSFDEFITQRPKLRISLSSKGSLPEIMFTQMLEYNGLTLDDVEAWGCDIIYLNQDEVTDVLPDGGVDMFVYNTAVPGPTMVEAATAADIRFVELSEDLLSHLSETYGYNLTTIPTGAYSFMEKDFETLSTYNILIASTDVPDEVVYKVTKSLHEQIDYLRGVHASLKDFTAESFLIGLNIPVHPGALKYYREIGSMQ